MKPFQILDIAMHWIARGFTISLLAHEVVHCFLIANVPDFGRCAIDLIILDWAINLWRSNKSRSRFSIGIGSTLALAGVIYLVVSGSIRPFSNTRDIMELGYIFGGLLSLIWIAIRSLANSEQIVAPDHLNFINPA